MKKIFVLSATILTITFFASCARGITVQDAANGKARCGKNYLK